MRSLLVFFDDLSIAMSKYLWGPIERRPTKEERATFLCILPRGDAKFHRVLRDVTLGLFLVRNGIKQKSFLIRAALLLIFGPLLMVLEGVLAVSRFRSRTVVSAPASKILNLIRFLVPKKAYERIFAQTVADFREEYFLDLAQGRVRRARWLHLCLYLTLIATTFLWLGTSTAKKVVALWKAG
jgi:hypothetical protein